MKIKNVRSEYRLDEKRFLSLDEFGAYAGLGRNNARELAGACEVLIKIKSRLLIDRIKFDQIPAEKVEEPMYEVELSQR